MSADRIRGIIGEMKIRLGGQKKSKPLPEAPSAKQRHVATQIIKGQPTTCTFCRKPCDADHSKFNGISLDGKALVCSNCISYFSTRIGLLDTIEADWSSHDVVVLKTDMERTIAGQPGPLHMKRVVVEIAMRICRYHAASYEAQRSKKQGPKPLRILVKGEDGDAFFGLLSRVVKLAGIMALATTVDEHGSGLANDRLLRICRNDQLMAQYSVVFVKDGPVISDDNLTLVCMSESPKAVSLDGPDRIENN